MSGNNAIDAVPVAAENVKVGDNTSSILMQHATGTSSDIRAAQGKGTEAAQSTLNSMFGTPELFDSDKAATKIDQDWDKAFKAGNFDTVNKEMTTAVNLAFQHGGMNEVNHFVDKLTAGTQTEHANILANVEGNTVNLFSAKETGRGYDQVDQGVSVKLDNASDHHAGDKPATAGAEQVKPSTELASEWDQAAKSGDFSKSNADIIAAAKEAFKEHGMPGVKQLQDDLGEMTKTPHGGPLLTFHKDGAVTLQNIHTLTEQEAKNTPDFHYDQATNLVFTELSDPVRFSLTSDKAPPLQIHGRESVGQHEQMTMKPNMTMGADGTAVEAPPAGNHEQMTMKPNMTMGADGTAVEVPSPAAEAKIDTLAQDMASGKASEQQIADDLQAALKSGANLNELVEEVDAKVGTGFRKGHLKFQPLPDGTNELDYSSGIGGHKMVVNGTDVKLGAPLR